MKVYYFTKLGHIYNERGMKDNFLRWSCKETKAEKVTGPVFSCLVSEETDTARKIHLKNIWRKTTSSAPSTAPVAKLLSQMNYIHESSDKQKAWHRGVGGLSHQTERPSKAKGARGLKTRGAQSLLREVRKRKLKWVRELQMAVLYFWVTKATGTGLWNPATQLCFPHSLKPN